MTKRPVLIATAAAFISLAFAGQAAATTTTYNCTGSAQNFTVPAGVSSVAFTVKGAGGGRGGDGETAFWGTKDGGGGGTGASYTGKWAVTAGQVVTIKVGCNGGNGTSKAHSGSPGGGGWGFFTGGSGGWSGGKSCGFLCTKSPTGAGAGGGGASGIQIGSLSLVAGGGGGGGGGAYWSGGGGAYAAANGGDLANGSKGGDAGAGNGGGGGSGGGGGVGQSAGSGDNGGNGGQNGRSKASTDAALTDVTLNTSGGAGQGGNGSIVLTYFAAVGVTGAPTGTVNASPVALTLSYPEAGHTFECRVDSGSWAACTSPVSVSGLKDGSRTWEVRAVDGAGNRGPVTSRTWTVDGTPPPAPAITNAPSGTVGINLVSFGFSNSEQGATLTCSFDGAAFGPCGSSPKVLTGLSEGAHAYVVKATDQYGNSSTTQLSWSVDSSAVRSVSGNTGPAKSASSSPTPTGVAGSCALAKVTNPGDLVCWDWTRNPTVVPSLGGGGVQITTGSTGLDAPAYCVLMETGRIKCTGSNLNGRFGTGNTTGSPNAAHPTWNTTSDPAGWVETSGITNAVQVAMAPNDPFTCAVLADKTVRCWGRDEAGRVTGTGSPTHSVRDVLTPSYVAGLNVAVTKVAPQNEGACVLAESGTAWCWGDPQYGSLGRYQSPTGFYGEGPGQVQAIVSGKPASKCTSTNGGPFVCLNTPVIEPLTGLVDISSGSAHTCAVKSDGTVWCWGAGLALGDGREYCSLSGECDWETNSRGSNQGAVKVSGITDAVKVSAAGFGTCALRSTGEVSCWGYSPYLGDGSGPYTRANSPVSLPNISPGSILPAVGKAVGVSLGAQQGGGCVTLDVGLLRCWGTFNWLPKSNGQNDRPGLVTVPFGPFVVTAPPEAPIVATPASPTRSTSASISFKGESGATFKCSLDGGTWSTCTSPKSLSSLTDGSHTFSVKQSNAGGESPATSVTWMVSTSLAAPSFDSATVPTTTGSKSASIAFTGASGATFQCSVDGGPYSECTSPKAITVSAAGKHSLSVFSIKNGLVGPSATAEWTVSDVVVNRPVLSGAPTGTVKERTASVSFSSTTSGATFTCSLDGAAYAACTSPRSLTGLADGEHTLSVKAVKDGVESDAESASWTVDATPPARPVLTPAVSGFTSPSAGALSGTVTSDSLSVSLPPVETGVVHECSTGAGFAPCRGSTTVSGLAPGQTKTLSVRAIDDVGNVSDVAIVTVTRAGTVTPVVSGAPSGRVASDAASIAFRSSTSGATFVCSIDGGSYSACTSPKSLSGLADGTRTFRVKAVKDGVESEVASAEWVVDTTAPPLPSLGGVPSGVTSSKSASVTVSSSEPGVSFRCSVDGGAYAACSSPRALSGLADGAHSIAVTASDSVGNTSAPVTRAWSVDTVAPAKPVVSGAPSGDTSATSATVNVAKEAGSKLECKLDSDPWAECSMPLALESLAEGSHTLSVRETDAASNVSEVAAATWTVDVTAPKVTVSGTPKGLVKDTTASVSFTVDQADTVECSLDGAEFAACTSPVAVGPLSDGSHSFSVRAKDAAGNKTVVVTDSWKVDTSKPSTPLLSGAPAAATTADAAVIAFTGTSGNEFRCSIDGGTPAACTSPISLSGLADGDHSVSVRQLNAAGTLSDAAVANWKVDRSAPAAPTVTLVSPTSSTTGQSTASISYSTESGATALCSLNGAAFAACSASPVSLSGLVIGTYSLAVKARDAAGNVGDAKTVTWQVVLPAPSILTPSAGVKTVYKKTVNGKATWALKVGLLFSTGGDTRTAAQFATIQVAVDKDGKPVATKPSDSQAPPPASTYANGVCIWSSSGEVTRTSVAQPVWVRASNKGGKWTNWVQLTP